MGDGEHQGQASLPPLLCSALPSCILPHPLLRGRLRADCPTCPPVPTQGCPHRGTLGRPGSSWGHQAVQPRSFLSSPCTPPWKESLMDVCFDLSSSLCPGPLSGGARWPRLGRGYLSSASAPVSLSQTLSRGFWRC